MVDCVFTERAISPGRRSGSALASPDVRKKRIGLPEQTDSLVIATGLAKASSAESHGQVYPILAPALHGSRIRPCPNNQKQSPLSEMACDSIVLAVSASCPKRCYVQLSRDSSPLKSGCALERAFRLGPSKVYRPGAEGRQETAQCPVRSHLRRDQHHAE